MATQLLQTKLTVPLLRPAVVYRPRLINKLNQVLHVDGFYQRLTLVSAPAGFGKTTLVAEWLSQPVAGPCAWLSLDKNDNDPARFYAYLIAALQTIDQAIGQAAQAMLQSPPAPPPDKLVTAIINDVIASQTKLILVLDDCHLLATPSIHQALALLLEHLPPNMHLVVTSRADPPLPLARWRARGLVNEIRQEELRFTAEETIAFLNEHGQLRLEPEQALLLATRTEGWIAGLQLATLAMQSISLSEPLSSGKGHGDAERFLQAFAGDDRYVLDYLSNEVLRQLPLETQEFLQQTAILQRLSGPLCDAVTGREDSQQRLAQLEQANLFVFALDNKRQWYRYHQLFADVLYSRLIDQVGREGVATLHRRAAAWYESNGLVNEAIEHALTGDDFGHAAQLIEGIANALMYQHGEVASLRRWLETLPDDVLRARPRLLLVQAWMQLWTTQPDAVERWLEAAIEALPSGPLPDEFHGQMATIRAQVAGLRGEAAQAISLAQGALAHLPEESLRLRGLALAALGNGYRTQGDARAAAVAFEQATAAFQKANLVVPTLITLTNQGLLLVIQGRLRQAENIYRRAEQLAAERYAQKLPAAGGVDIALGRLLREWNNLEEAAGYLRHGIELCRDWPGFAEEMQAGLLALAGVMQDRGSAEEALGLVEQAEAMAHYYGIPWWPVQVAVHRAGLWLAQGNVEAAGRWAEEQTDIGESLPVELHELMQLTLAQVRLAQGKPDEAIGRLTPLLQEAEAAGRTGSALSMWVLSALAHFQQHHPDRALLLLSQALDLAEPERYVRLFLDHGQTMTSLLALGVEREAWRKPRLSEYAAGLLDTLGEVAAASPPGAAAMILVEPLTEREQEVLQLIGQGLSNPEIAQELVIAVSTVKSHVKSIYGKLGVSNRFQAIERARQLNLLQ